MDVINIILAIIVSLGFCLTIFSKESDKRRYIGWIMMATAITIFGISEIIVGKIGIALFDFGIGLVDYWLAYFWYGIYKEKADAKELSKLNNKEKFLKQIMNYKR